MVVQVLEIEETEEKVLEAVDSGLSHPVALLAKLKSGGLDEDLIRASIWFLIDQGKLKLNRDWDLEVV